MAKRLNERELKEVKRLLLKGETPQAISEVFEVGVSSIYNYRNMFRAEGDEFPSVAGKRPKKIHPRDLNVQVLNLENKVGKVTIDDEDYYRVEVGDTTLMIPCTATKVQVARGSIVIDF